MEARCLELAERQRGWIATKQATELGLDPRAIRRMVASGRWRKVYPGVIVPAGSPMTWEVALRAAVGAGGDHTAASHRAAARVHRFDGYSENLIELTTPRHLRWQGVISHRRRLRIVDRTSVRGLAVTTPTRTIIDLASVVTLNLVEAALDSALMNGTTSFAYLERRLNEVASRGRNGVGAMKRLLAARRTLQAPNGSELERLFTRKVVLPYRLRPPTMQFPVMLDGDEFRIDFSYPDVLLGIELLGWRFHLGRRRWERDLARHNLLTNCGWTLLYFPWTDVVERPDWVAAKIRSALNRLGTLFVDENGR